MRIWDIHPKHLCRKHLLAEHRELHGLWNILTMHVRKGPSYAEASRGVGYSRHPETLRWVGKTKALYLRHGALVEEFARRGYHHRSPLDQRLARGKDRQDSLINTIAEQKDILCAKPCECFIDKYSI